MIKYNSKTGETLEWVELSESILSDFRPPTPDELIIMWLTRTENYISIDGVEHVFPKDTIIGSTGLHHLAIGHLKAHALTFNKSFLGMLNLEHESNLQGLFYYGSEVPVLRLQGSDKIIFTAALEMLLKEYRAEQIVPEVIQMIMQRILMLCAEIYEQQQKSEASLPGADLFRSFHRLVDHHFREKHTVAAYASMLNKSPKTLCNAFREAGLPSPLECIQDRIHIEARRLLKYTDQPISQMSLELGFGDIHAFSRFFKNKEGISPSLFRQTNAKGKIDKSTGENGKYPQQVVD